MEEIFIIGNQHYLLHPVQDNSAFEKVKYLVDHYNKEDMHGVQWDKRAMRCPKWIYEQRIDINSIFGRNPFYVKDVDAGWLLEDSNGEAHGYIHAYWSVHTPHNTDVDHVIGIQLHLEEILLRPKLHNTGIGRKMIQHLVSNIVHHVSKAYDADTNLFNCAYQIQGTVYPLSDSGKRAFDYLISTLHDQLHGIRLICTDVTASSQYSINT